jgi:hypothetical protein
LLLYSSNLLLGFSNFVLIEQLVVGQSIVEVKQAEVEDLHLEEATVAIIAMAREAGLLGN